MSSQIRPNRLEVSDRFPMLGFTIKTEGEGKRYEVTLASDAALFAPDARPKRTAANFYSSRAAGLQPVAHGEAVYVVPPEVLARFVGQEKLYYALATYPAGKSTPELPVMPSAGSPYISLKALSGRSLKRVRLLPSRHWVPSAYGSGGGGQLEWAGDAAMPGTTSATTAPASAPSAATPAAAPVPTAPAATAPSAAPPAAAPPEGTAAASALDYSDGFGYLPPAAPVATARRETRALAGEQSFSLNWDEVQAIAQPTDVSCWAASGAMVMGWRDRMSLTPETIARIAGSTTATGLDPAQVGMFAAELGLVAENPQSYTIEGFRQLLEGYGPLWVAAAVPGLHAVVVTGMYSDGAADGSDTYLRITDPWDRVTGTPGSPGGYLETHNTGSRYILSWADFVREYEGAFRSDGVNLQILHATGTASRQPNRSGASGYAMSAAMVRAQDATSFSINWDEVDVFPQRTRKSCWATAAAMVVGWRDQQCVTPSHVARIAGLTIDPNPQTEEPLWLYQGRWFAEQIGLEYEPPASYPIDGLRSMLEDYGPLWVAMKPPGTDGHAVVITGMYSGGAADGSDTYLRITDPWDRVVGTPGAPGKYLNTGEGQLPQTGSRYIDSWADFVTEYEALAPNPKKPRRLESIEVHVMHARDTAGRTPNRSGAAGYAMEVTSTPALDEATSEDDLHGIEGSVPPSESQALGAEASAAQAYPRALAEEPEYPQASRYEPAAKGNYRVSSALRTINRVVIHITDGGANINGTIGWFKNPSAKVSAHYIVGQDGEVVQMVRHNDVAWHAGRANRDSIGIEHVANTRGLMPTDAQYCASAALTRWLCDTYGIPIDRTHILGHAEADTKTTHTGCPNAVWDWDYFMGMVESATCYARPEATSQAASEVAASARVSLPPPPPPVVGVRPLNAEVVAAVAGAVIAQVISSNGRITWELDQLRGLKHPNDTAPTPAAAFKDAPTIRLDKWPVVEALTTDEISAWFTVDWQYNGRSLGNVRIANVGTNGALLQGLHVSARVMDDNIVYPQANPTHAALRVRFTYRFTASIGSDFIAVTDLHLYGDGSYDQTSRWEQS